MGDEVEIDELDKRIKAKEDLVRKLKMVKLHRTKHNAAELENLIQQWLRASQQALQDLQENLKENNPNSTDVSIETLLKHMNIEPESVGYCIEDEAFTL